MKQLLTSLLFLVLCTASFAGKTFTLRLTVYGLDNEQALEGMIVTCWPEDGQMVEGRTNAQGMVELTLTEKDYDVRVMDPNKKYRERSVFYYNSKRQNLELTAHLKLNRALENELIAQKTKITVEDSLLDLTCSDSASVTEAEFPGGYIKMSQFIAQNVDYPMEAMEEAISGKVYLKFIINPDGSVSDIRVVRGVSKEIDEEAVRVMCYMPKFIPATCNGVPVRSVFQIPIKFDLM